MNHNFKFILVDLKSAIKNLRKWVKFETAEEKLFDAIKALKLWKYGTKG